MNTVIADLTLRGMLGRRRAVLLFVLPAVLLALALGTRLAGKADPQTATMLLARLGIGTLLPLLGLIAGTGVIGPEIDDGRIIYLLTKPVARPVIALTKLAVAITLAVVFAAVPMLIAGLIVAGTAQGIAVGFAVGAAAGAVAYCAVFLALAVITRHAVVIGLLYAVIWESLVGGFAAGARLLSIQQWSLSLADLLSSAPTLHAEVRPTVAVPLLLIVSAAAAGYTGRRLRVLTLDE